MLKFLIAPVLLLVVAQAAALASREQLDRDGNVHLEWEYHEGNDSFSFKLTANTLGFVGFGISPKPEMYFSDIFVAGVYPNGTAYSGDYYSPVDAPSTPLKLDDSQDWTFSNAVETDGNTTIEFSRKRDTGDVAEDSIILFGNMVVIWARGESDVLTYHGFANRGLHFLTLAKEPAVKCSTGGLSAATAAVFLAVVIGFESISF